MGLITPRRHWPSCAWIPDSQRPRAETRPLLWPKDLRAGRADDPSTARRELTRVRGRRVRRPPALGLDAQWCTPCGRSVYPASRGRGRRRQPPPLLWRCRSRPRAPGRLLPPCPPRAVFLNHDDLARSPLCCTQASKERQGLSRWSREVQVGSGKRPTAAQQRLFV